MTHVPGPGGFPDHSSLPFGSLPSGAPPVRQAKAPLGFDVELDPLQTADLVGEGPTYMLRRRGDSWSLRLIPEHGLFYVAGLRTYSAPGLVQVDEVRMPHAHVNALVGAVDAAAFNPRAIVTPEDAKHCLHVIDEALGLLKEGAGADHHRRARLLTLRDELQSLRYEPHDSRSPADLPGLGCYVAPPPPEPENSESLEYAPLDLGCLRKDFPLEIVLSLKTEEKTRFVGYLAGVLQSQWNTCLPHDFR